MTEQGRNGFAIAGAVVVALLASSLLRPPAAALLAGLLPVLEGRLGLVLDPSFPLDALLSALAGFVLALPFLLAPRAAARRRLLAEEGARAALERLRSAEISACSETELLDPASFCPEGPGVSPPDEGAAPEPPAAPGARRAAPGSLAALAEESARLAAARLDSARRSLLARDEALVALRAQLAERERTGAAEYEALSRAASILSPSPEELPRRPEILFASYRKRGYGSERDFIDAFRIGKNGIGLVVARVEGRGGAPVLGAALLKSALRARAQWNRNSTEVASSVRDDLDRAFRDAGLVGAFLYAFIDLEAGRVSAAGSAILEAYIFRRRTGKVEPLGGGGDYLGHGKGLPFIERLRSLEEGDRLFLPTGPGAARPHEIPPRILHRAKAPLDRATTGLVADLLLAQARKSCEDAEAAPATAAESSGADPEAPSRAADEACADLSLLACEFRAFAVQESRAGATPRKPSPAEDWARLSARAAELAKSGKAEEAAACYERVLGIEPEDLQALNNLGALYWKLGRYEEARTRFESAARVAPDDPRVAKNLAMAARRARLENQSETA